MAEAITWGVSADDVMALASHADVTVATVEDPEFGTSAGHRITRASVEKWILDVAAVVDVKLRRRVALSTESLPRIESAAKSVVACGAAAYLVDAAYPTRAGVNDNSSYGNVLWTRYRQELDELVEAVDEWADAGDDDGGVAVLPVLSQFPEPRISDDLRW